MEDEMDSQSSIPNDAELDAKQREFFERARKGVLTHLNQKGGTLNLGDLHDFSLNRYLIQHQRFSQLIESLVNGGLMEYDFAAQTAKITEEGKIFVSQ